MPRNRKRAEQLYRCSEACRASMLLMGKIGAREEDVFVVDACSRMCSFLAASIIEGRSTSGMEAETARTLRRAAEILCRSRGSYCKLIGGECMDLAEACEAVAQALLSEN